MGYPKFTAKELNFIRENYLVLPVKRMCKMMDRSSCGVSNAIKNMGLEIPQHIRDERKAIGMFRKGIASPNKGKQQVDFMSPEAIAKCVTSRFKKGHKPHNAHDIIGTITIRHNYSKQNYPPYKWIKLEGGMKQLHVHIWESANGTVHQGHIIVFKDKNTMNCVLDNLESITLEENMQRNSINRYPTELKEIIRLQGKIKKTLKQKQQQYHEQQH